MFLLDTNIISEMRKQKPHGAVLSWFRQLDPSDIHISAVTLGELQAGVETVRKQDLAKAQEIEIWLDMVADSFQILAADGPVFREWARLMHGKRDEVMMDGMIAATARVHRLKVATRNVKDMMLFPVDVVNPFGVR
ncbi:MAG: type II toxin-antitoxin system VapC family toxin [Candidatus Solibacter usitatus]|nr:type II toxin-antitoxin system VapC family toxin [Candidatus Solibacter usitatus]